MSVKRKLSLGTPKNKKGVLTPNSSFPMANDDDDFVTPNVEKLGNSGKDNPVLEESLSQMIEREVGHLPMPFPEVHLSDLEFLDNPM